MRSLVLKGEDQVLTTEEAISCLLAASTGRLVCPNLRHLTCHLSKVHPRLIPCFLSPYLTRFTLRPHQSYLVGDYRLDLCPTFQVLPTSCLQELIIDFCPGPADRLEGEVSSTIERCGDSLRKLDVSVSLSEAALNHILRLKNIRLWCACNPPPATLPFPTTLPPPQALILGNKESHEWISWLTWRVGRTPGRQDSPLEYTGLQATLTYLSFQEFVCSIDATFISPFSHFPNLVHLEVPSGCWALSDCSFFLTNRDAIQLSAALPRLEWLDLGLPCSETSSTAVSCLLALSVHCKNLRNLRIHFNTANLTDDIKLLSEDPDLGSLQSLPARCPLESLSLAVCHSQM